MGSCDWFLSSNEGPAHTSHERTAPPLHRETRFARLPRIALLRSAHHRKRPHASPPDCAPRSARFAHSTAVSCRAVARQGSKDDRRESSGGEQPEGLRASTDERSESVGVLASERSERDKARRTEDPAVLIPRTALSRALPCSRSRDSARRLPDSSRPTTSLTRLDQRPSTRLELQLPTTGPKPVEPRTPPAG
jgi:hypothetical protein